MKIFISFLIILAISFFAYLVFNNHQVTMSESTSSHNASGALTVSNSNPIPTSEVKEISTKDIKQGEIGLIVEGLHDLNSISEKEDKVSGLINELDNDLGNPDKIKALSDELKSAEDYRANLMKKALTEGG